MKLTERDQGDVGAASSCSRGARGVKDVKCQTGTGDGKDVRFVSAATDALGDTAADMGPSNRIQSVRK